MKALRAVVTGAAGFIGSHLVERCAREGWDVLAVDSLTTYYSPAAKTANAAAFASLPTVTYLEKDLLELDLPEVLAGADIVFHLAAQPGVRRSWGQSFEAYMTLNVTLTQRLLEALRDVPSLKRLVFASSSSVYGDAERLPTPEDLVLRPVSPYGATKAAGEHLCWVYHRCYGLPVVILRYFSVYGPRQRPDMAFHRAIEAALNGAAFPLNGDGRQTRDFTFVADAVEGTVLAAQRGRPGATYNIGGGSRVSMLDALAAIEAAVGRVDTVHQPVQRGDARDTAADISLARRELDYSPAWDIAQGVAAQAEWHEARAVART